MTSLDQAISAAAGAEGKYTADVGNVDRIKEAIKQAQAPLPQAVSTLAEDARDFNAKLDNLAEAAQQAKVPVPEVPPETPLEPAADVLVG